MQCLQLALANKKQVIKPFKPQFLTIETELNRLNHYAMVSQFSSVQTKPLPIVNHFLGFPASLVKP